MERGKKEETIIIIVVKKRKWSLKEKTMDHHVNV